MFSSKLDKWCAIPVPSTERMSDVVSFGNLTTTALVEVIRPGAGSFPSLPLANSPVISLPTARLTAHQLVRTYKSSAVCELGHGTPAATGSGQARKSSPYRVQPWSTVTETAYRDPQFCPVNRAGTGIS